MRWLVCVYVSTTHSCAFAGADTTITLTPDVRTLTLYPTETYTVVQGTTIYLTSMSTQFVVEQGTTTVTHPAPSPTTTQGGESGSDGGDVTTTWVTESGSSSSFSRRSTATSTSTSIPTPHETWMGAVQAPCRPGDAEESIPGIFSLTPDNKITLCELSSKRDMEMCLHFRSQGSLRSVRRYSSHARPRADLLCRHSRDHNRLEPFPGTMANLPLEDTHRLLPRTRVSRLSRTRPFLALDLTAEPSAQTPPRHARVSDPHPWLQS